MRLEQKYQAEYKEIKFKGKNYKKDFDLWLKKVAVKKIVFEDHGQDCLEWWIDEGGEVLHSWTQLFVWNGKIVASSQLRVGKQIGILNLAKQQTDLLDFIVKEIIDVKGAKNE